MVMRILVDDQMVLCQRSLAYFCVCTCVCVCVFEGNVCATNNTNDIYYEIQFDCVHTFHTIHRKLRHSNHFHRSSLSIHSMSDANKVLLRYSVVWFCRSNRQFHLATYRQVLHKIQASVLQTRTHKYTITCTLMEAIFNDTSITGSMIEHSLISVLLHSDVLQSGNQYLWYVHVGK